MPTIDELPPAVSVSDTDEILVSQNDVARKATRAQLHSGVQPELALRAGTLLGRVADGVGAPEEIFVGTNLSIVNNTINAPSPFLISGLAAAGLPMPNDLVAVAQGGQNAAMGYGTFLGGMHRVPGVDGSQLVTGATGAPGSRKLVDLAADSIGIEWFGAVGDGVTDDTSAFAAALASGRAIRLDNRVYIINGPIEIGTTTSILGVPGGTVISRQTPLQNRSWFSISSASLVVHGVCFDGGGLVTADCPLLSITTACQTSSFTQCQFINGTGSSQGQGLEIDAALGSIHCIENSSLRANGQWGLIARGAGTLIARGVLASGNSAGGISVATETSCQIEYSHFQSNTLGVAIGDWNTTALAAQSSSRCIVRGNTCAQNTLWGLVIGGRSCCVSDNVFDGNGAFDAGGNVAGRLLESIFSGNIVSNSRCGLDMRSSVRTLLYGNSFLNCVTGVAVGGSQHCKIFGNQFVSNEWAVVVSAIEPALSALPTGPLTIDGNWIGFSTPQGGGIQVLDGAVGVSVTGNSFAGWGSSSVGQCLWLHTDSAVLFGNRWNNQTSFLVGAGEVANRTALVVPDIADRVLVTAASAAVESVITIRQSETIGQICFIRVTSGGAGYTHAQIDVAGSGSGAAAQAIVSNGQVVWIVVENAGSGYGAIGSDATVTITGDGSGAGAVAFVGLPVLDARQLRISCNTAVVLNTDNASPSLTSWTGYNTTIPAQGAAELEGAFGGWRLIAAPPVDYLAPHGDGGVTLKSVDSGNMTLRPAIGGSLFVSSGLEPIGYSSNVGRGAPVGRIAAPAGSDYRNLDGGPGTTFWIKQSGTDANGWTAVA